MKKCCVLLSGCGHRDGSEINEAVFSLLALSQEGMDFDIYAPNREQYDSINHLNGAKIEPQRNILEESARIARGDIKALSELKVSDYEALILPGGYGAFKNFTNFPAEDGVWKISQDVREVIISFHKEHKVIGAICIFPSILALLFNDLKIKITTGLNPESQKLISSTNAQIEAIDSDQIVIDEIHKIVSTPAFMNDVSLAKVYIGISKLIKQIKSMVI